MLSTLIILLAHIKSFKKFVRLACTHLCTQINWLVATMTYDNWCYRIMAQGFWVLQGRLLRGLHHAPTPPSRGLRGLGPRRAVTSPSRPHHSMDPNLSAPTSSCRNPPSRPHRSADLDLVKPPPRRANLVPPRTRTSTCRHSAESTSLLHGLGPHHADLIAPSPHRANLVAPVLGHRRADLVTPGLRPHRANLVASPPRRTDHVTSPTLGA